MKQKLYCVGALCPTWVISLGKQKKLNTVRQHYAICTAPVREFANLLLKQPTRSSADEATAGRGASELLAYLRTRVSGFNSRKTAWMAWLSLTSSRSPRNSWVYDSVRSRRLPLRVCTGIYDKSPSDAREHYRTDVKRLKTQPVNRASVDCVFAETFRDTASSAMELPGWASRCLGRSCARALDNEWIMNW